MCVDCNLKFNKDCFTIDCKCGTDGYCAPEQYNKKMGYSSDIYSIAVTALEVWVGTSLFFVFNLILNMHSIKIMRKHILSQPFKKV